MVLQVPAGPGMGFAFVPGTSFIFLSPEQPGQSLALAKPAMPGCAAGRRSQCRSLGVPAAPRAGPADPVVPSVGAAVPLLASGANCPTPA